MIRICIDFALFGIDVGLNEWISEKLLEIGAPLHAKVKTALKILSLRFRRAETEQKFDFSTLVPMELEEIKLGLVKINRYLPID